MATFADLLAQIFGAGTAGSAAGGMPLPGAPPLGPGLMAAGPQGRGFIQELQRLLGTAAGAARPAPGEAPGGGLPPIDYGQTRTGVDIRDLPLRRPPGAQWPSDPGMQGGGPSGPTAAPAPIPGRSGWPHVPEGATLADLPRPGAPEPATQPTEPMGEPSGVPGITMAPRGPYEPTAPLGASSGAPGITLTPTGRPLPQVRQPDPDAIMRGATAAQAARQPAGGQPAAAGPSGMQTLLQVLARALQGAARVNPTSPGFSAFAQGASGALGAAREDEDRRLKREAAKQKGELAQRAERRAEAAETRAERKDRRAAEIHELNVRKVATEVARLIGGALTPDEFTRLQREVTARVRASRQGSFKEMPPAEINKAAKEITDHIMAERQRLLGVPTPGAPAPAPAGAAPGGAALRPAAGAAAPTIDPRTGNVKLPATAPEGTTYTHPTNGTKVIFRGGRWQPLR